MKYVFTVLMFRQNCEKEKILPLGKRLGEQLFTVSKDDPTDYLLITKGKHQLYSGATWESPPDPSPIMEQTDFNGLRT